METNIALEYIITHVFCPLRLPGADDHSFPNDQALIEAVVDAAHAYTRVVADAGHSEWHSIANMLENLGVTVQSAKLDTGRVMSQLSDMQQGGTCPKFVTHLAMAADDSNDV
ncbi:hypothetical protein JVT61DRAFT_3506 [Boletus reticuloceps]|uniref:DUF6606 domain-containing protein n=1 Tax=Boletus reticuloceps TaxID=495285 RepID=A0A8I2YNJ8_9AGAM|nr:hypothetical protein JVT61DRAFT_3506 [Boletus reticuloceps]